jgi:acetyl-CoA carboxylase biotin carboxyl carrier protein
MSNQIDTKTISKLAEILDKNSLTEIEFEGEDFRICITRDNISIPTQQVTTVAAPVATPVVTAPAATPASAPAATNDEANIADHKGLVKSPMVGIAYLSPEPGADAYIKVGSTVNEGDTVLLIEAMKTFNPVKAHKSGKVTQIIIEDGAPVEFGEPLLIIE